MTIVTETPAPKPWRDILDGGWWQTGRAECGCETWAHTSCDHDEYAGGRPVLAVLHSTTVCADGDSDAHLHAPIARALGFGVPDGVATVAVTRELLAVAQLAVASAAERARAENEDAELAGFIQRRIAAISDRMADEAEFDAWYGTVDGQPFGHIEAKLLEVAANPVFEARMFAGYLAAEQAKPLPNPAKIAQFQAAVAAHTERGRREAEDLLNPAVVVERMAAEWDGVTVAGAEAGPPAAAPVASAPVAPFTVPPAPAAEAPALVPTGDDDAPADKVCSAFAARRDEREELCIELGELLRARFTLSGQAAPPEYVNSEVIALQELTISERVEAIDAIRDGRMERLGLKPSDFLATSRLSKSAWIRLREGQAATWSVAGLKCFTDGELEALMNPEPVMPVFGKLFYAKGVQILAGPGGIGKTWIALAACLDGVDAVFPRPAQSVYVDLDNNFELYARMRLFGVARERIRDQTLAMINVQNEASEQGVSDIAMLWAVISGLEASPPRVVIIDSLTRVISATGDGNSNDNDLATRVLSAFERLAQVCCVIILDHTGHASEAMNRPRGASAKTDTVQQVITLSETKMDAERYPDVTIAASVTSTKDRYNGVRTKLKNPADRSSKPDLGLITIKEDPDTGRFSVEMISAKVIAGAQGRRESDTGVAFAAEARKLILEAVDAAARAAVTADAAKLSNGKPVPPLSERGAVDAAWEQLKGRGRKSDVTAVFRAMVGAQLVEYQAGWGSTPGIRYRARGGITGGRPDPVDLAKLAAEIDKPS